MVGEENVHEEECSQVKEYADRENYQPRAPEENRKRKQQFP